jgi:hypothetical protein
MSNIFNETAQKMSLYQAYVEEIKKIYQDEDDDMSESDMFDTIDGEIDITSLIDKVGNLYLKEDAYLSAFKTRVDNLQLRQKKQKEKVEQLKKSLQKLIKLSPEKKFKFPEFTAFITKKQYGKLVLGEKYTIPDEFYKIEKNPDNTKLKERLIKAYDENDEEFLESIDGVYIETNVESLTIRKS